MSASQYLSLLIYFGSTRFLFFSNKMSLEVLSVYNETAAAKLKKANRLTSVMFFLEGIYVYRVFFADSNFISDEFFKFLSDNTQKSESEDA